MSDELQQEIPEMPEEMFNLSKDSLKKINSLVDRLNNDLFSKDKTLKAAAAIMIHIIMNALSDKHTVDSVIKGEAK